MGNNYGILKEVRELVAKELADEIMEVKTRVGLLTLGHTRWEHIDRIFKNEMGRNVKEYWAAQSQVYKSMIRRAVWERALAIVQERVVAAGMKRSSRQRTKRLTSVESLLELV